MSKKLDLILNEVRDLKTQFSLRVVKEDDCFELIKNEFALVRSEMAETASEIRSEALATAREIRAEVASGFKEVKAELALVREDLPIVKEQTGRLTERVYAIEVKQANS